MPWGCASARRKSWPLSPHRFVGGVAGALYAQVNFFIDPEVWFDIVKSTEILVMVNLGGNRVPGRASGFIGRSDFHPILRQVRQPLAHRRMVILPPRSSSCSCSSRPRGGSWACGSCRGLFPARELFKSFQVMSASSKIDHLTKRVRRLFARSRIGDVKVEAGHTHGIIGPNGAGETTSSTSSPASTSPPRAGSVSAANPSPGSVPDASRSRGGPHVPEYPPAQKPDRPGECAHRLRFAAPLFAAGSDAAGEPLRQG